MIEVRGLTCERGEAMLFNALNFSLHSGKVLLVRGANGAGKTSLLRILGGLSAPRAGEVLWCGERVAPLALALRARTLYLGHTAPLKDDLTVSENLSYALRLDGCAVSEQRRLDALNAVGLGARQRLSARQLSQGQRRRIGIARMMLAGRTLWLLDEPTTALDSQGVDLFKSVLTTHLASNGLAVVTTHQALDFGPAAQELILQ